MAITENELPPTVALAGNPMWVDCETDEYAEDFIGLHYDPEVYIDSSWESASQELRYEPDSDHKAVVDLHKLLEWDPEKEFTFPENCGTLLVKRNNLRRQWRLNRSEKYGNPLTEYNDAVASGTRYILPGKISDKKFGQYNDNGTNWWTKLQADKFFLTNFPKKSVPSSYIKYKTKTTDAWASERLYYFVFGSGVSSLNLRLKAYYTDGTEEAVITRSTIGSVSQYDVYEIITSFSSLGIYLLDQSKTISHYEIWLTDQSANIISEVFKYYMDHVKKPDARYFIFSNAYKMYEGIRFTGKSAEEAKVESIISDRDLEKDYSVSARTLIKDQVREGREITTSSGWLSKDEMAWYRELLLSKEVYEIINGVLIPVNITSNQVLLNDDQSNLRSMQILYQYSFDRVPDLYDISKEGLEAAGNGEDFFTGEDAFVSGSNLITGMTNNGFSSWTAPGGSYDYEFYDLSGGGAAAYSNNINVGFVPLILKYLYANNDEAVLATLTDTAGVDVLTVDKLILGEYSANGLSFGLLYTTHPNSTSAKRFQFEKEGTDLLQTIGLTLELKVASKRFLEYLYENEL